MMKRREFLKTVGASVALSAAMPLGGAEAQKVSASGLPRWRGFNLLEKFIRQQGRNPGFREADFDMIAEWGFDFVRLPMSYLCWSNGDPKAWRTIREEELKDIDKAVEFGRARGIHVNLNFHRAPGYCVNPPKEPLSLWENEEALETCAYHWATFARRYKGVPNERVSFDLLNEPPDIPAETYVRVAKRLVAAIRVEDPERLIIADGLKWGREPVHGLVDAKIGQSTRGYDPMRISHWKANWVNGSDKWPVPEWPLKEGNSLWDKERLKRERIQPWKELEAKGVGVHVGEWGAFNQTPHDVTLAWMRDQLALWKEAGWGWALWNLRGAFGVLDSGRSDVKYEDYKGHKIDRAMLEVLRAG